MGDINPYELFKYIQEDATNEKLFEASDKAYKDVEEGKLYPNLNNIDDPEEAIQSLKEDEEVVDEKKDKHPDVADNPKIKTDNAGVTEEPEKTKVQQAMDKETPDVDKKSDFETSAGIKKVKDPAKARGYKVGGIKTEEGKLPANLNNVDNAEEYIQDLAEFDSNDNNGEIIADGISEESVARDLALKNNGVAVQNPDTRLWSVKTTAQENSSGSQGVVPASAARESVDEKFCKGECKPDCGCGKAKPMGKKDEEDSDDKEDKKEDAKESVVDEEKTSADGAGQPEEGATSKAQDVVSKSAARGKATDNPSADSQSTKCEDQDGAGKANAQKMVSQSAARTSAIDKQTADANAPISTTEMPKQTATKVPYVKAAESKVDEDQSSDGKAHAQQTVSKSAARGKATDNPSADANASIPTTEQPKPAVGSVPNVKAEKPGMTGTSANAQMKNEGKEEGVEEAVDVSVSTDDGDVNISSDGVTTTVTTSNSPAALPIDSLGTGPEILVDPIDDLGPEMDPMLDDELFLDDEEQPEFSDLEALEMAERLMVAEHLSKKMDEGCGMSAKQKKFVEDMKGKKFSKKNKKKVDDKKKEIK